MRTIVVIVVGLFLVPGCRKAQLPLAGGKPVGHWVEALKGPDPKVRKKAAQKLGNVGTADKAVLPALIGALKDPAPEVRAEAALALLRIGPPASEAVPALTEMAQKDQDAGVRDHATKALAKVQGGG